MTRYLVVGRVPLNRQRVSDGAYLTADSFSGLKAGSAPVCRSHWREDGYTCKHSAAWALDGDGLTVVHLLDDERPQERALLDEVREGRLFWSYGQQGTPDATRQAIAQQAAQHGQGGRVYWPSALKSQTVAHWAYVPVANFTQDAPIYILGTDSGAGWRLESGVLSQYETWNRT